MKSQRSNVFTQRYTKKTKRWRRACLKRDGWRCLLCEAKRPLHVHHLERWVDAPTKRLDVTNGATLCIPCHVHYHHGNGEPFPAHVTDYLRDMVLHGTTDRPRPRKLVRVVIPVKLEGIFDDPMQQFKHRLALGF